MTTILKQSIQQSFRENLNLYTEDYPCQEFNNGISPSDDAISNMVNWATNAFENATTEEKGTLEDWIAICAQTMYDFFDYKDGDFDEQNETWNFLISEAKRYSEYK